ncbi:MAG: sulfotransferase, partial [Streptosporangiaceae bacterium]
YEDFVRQPGDVVANVLTWLGLPYQPSDLAQFGDGRMTLEPSHAVAGNPSRFRHGEIVLRPDEAWRDQMPPRDRRAVTTIALPFIVRYGWLRRGGD